MKLLEQLKTWPKLPPEPEEATCILCGCQENTPCPGGCGWQDIKVGSDWGICTACVDGRLCGIGSELIMSAFQNTPWQPKKSCPCPICKNHRKRRKKS